MTKPSYFVALLVTLSVLSSGAALCAQTPASEEDVQGYISVGRIKWDVPSSDFSFAVPHFTMGPRIKCKGPARDCEISVAARDITVGLSERRAKLSAGLSPYVRRSKEKAIRFRSYGVTRAVTYVTLTDLRPKPGEFRILTEGFAVKGPAVIQFQHLSNNANDIKQILDVVQKATALDTLGIWAWKLTDYKIVCESRFPAYKQVNDSAFRASPFSSVDVIGFWQLLAQGAETTEEIRGNLASGREKYAKNFDDRAVLERQNFCKNFPTWVAEAAKDLPAK